MSDHRGIRQRLLEASQTKTFHVIVGTLSGIAIILAAVAISALVFRAYGWGLFVLTPLVVGLTTGYLVNRQELQSAKATNGLVLLSAALGCFGLILFALEGLVCLILAAPLGALLAIAGGALGRRAARVGKDPSGPLYCIALLPLMFAADAISPPDAMMLTNESIVINARSCVSRASTPFGEARWCTSNWLLLNWPVGGEDHGLARRETPWV